MGRTSRISRPILSDVEREEVPISPAIDYRRQTLLFNPQDFQGVNITVVGLGNIGSHTALALARLGVPGLTIYDPDKVELHNLTSQAYGIKDLGREKREIIWEKIRNEINPSCVVTATCTKLADPISIKSYVSPIIIIAVDSMKEREHIHLWMKKHKIKPELLIDGRIGGNQLEIYNCLTLEEWEKTFVEHPSPDPCGGRFICYVSLIIAGLITNSVKRFLKKEPITKSIIMHLDTLQILTSV